ncbi:MAG TPA: peptide ABC transporter substrate-binding protein [Ktedonobacteraceae bacterium]|nr:peptide ABC transporter substrate-binding protein [Ktedonobacteraceae bacterium]
METCKKRILALLPAFVCVLALLLTGCSHDVPQPYFRASQILILPEAGVSDIATFDPGLSTDVPSVKAISMIFTGLVGLDNHNNIVGYLAQSWDVSPDHLTYTFHLRPNLRFSDGTVLKSTDVAYSIDRALQPATKSSTAAYYLRYIKDASLLAAGKIKTIIDDSIKTPDDTTVVITAASPVSSFLDTLTFPCSYVIERSLVAQYGNSDFADHLNEGGGGDGPFKVQEYTHDKRIVFIPNPNYFGPLPQLMKVIFQFYPDAYTAYSAYLSNQLDEAPVPFDDGPAARTQADFHTVPQLQINYYAMNYNVKPFDNIDIRQAFELAINKNVVALAAWKNSVIPTNHIVPQGMPGYNQSLIGVDGVRISGDQSLAKTLFTAGMRQEGWTNISQVPPVTLTYSSGGNKAVRNEVFIVQQYWYDILGVNVRAEDVDVNTLHKDIASNHLQFWRSTWVTDYPDPQNWTTLQFGQDSRYNNMNYGQNHSSDAAAQQQIQKQLEAADLNPNTVARLQSYNSVEQSLVNDVAWLPMEQATITYLLKACVSGYGVSSQDLIPANDWGGTYIQPYNTDCLKT